MKNLIKKLIYYPAIVFTKGFFATEHVFKFKENDAFSFKISLQENQEIEVFLFRENVLNLTLFYKGEKVYTPSLEEIKMTLKDKKGQIIPEQAHFTIAWAITPLSFGAAKATGERNYQGKLSLLTDNSLLKAFGEDALDCFTVVYEYNFKDIPKESNLEIQMKSNHQLHTKEAQISYQKVRKWF